MKQIEWNQHISPYRQLLDEMKIGKGDTVPFSFAAPLNTVLMLMAIWERQATAFPICHSLTEDEKRQLIQGINTPLITEAEVEADTDVEGTFNFRESCFELHHSERDALWVATSGSSGTPKVVRLSYDNLYFSALGSIEFYHMQEEQSSLISIPLHHVGGIMILVRSLLSKGRLLIPHREREICQYFNHPASMTVDYFSLVPTQLQRMIYRKETIHCLQKAKVILVGGSSIPKRLLDRSRKLGLSLSPTYGMSESCAQLAALHPFDFIKDHTKGLSILPYREIRIDDDGHLFFKGKTLCKGYVGEDENNEENFFQTKDLARWDNESHLVVLGRADSVIISGGENIMPEEVEQKIYTLYDVEEVHCIPLEDLEFGQVLYGMVNTPVNSWSDYRTRIKEGQIIAPHKIPKKFLPLSVSDKRVTGIKVSKRDLAQKIRRVLPLKNQLHKEHFGKRENPSLILLHGFMGSGRDYAPLIEKLSNRFYITTIDLPGHGKTPLPDRKISFADVGDAIAFYLAETHRPHSLFGYSMGGRMALYLLGHYPMLFKAGIIESASAGLESLEERKRRFESDSELLTPIKTKEEFKEFLDRWYQTPLFGRITNHPNFEELLKLRSKQDIRRLDRSLNILSVGNQPNLLPVLQDNEVPLLYLSGDLDQKYNQLGEELAATIPNLHHQSFSELGHNIHFEALDKVVKVINQFLS